MLRVGLLLTLAILGAQANILPLLPCSLGDLVNTVNQTLTNFQTQIDNGQVVKPPGWDQAINTRVVVVPGSPSLSLGFITLPLDLFCAQTGIFGNLVCRVGAFDCTYVHNKYSGMCANSPNPVAGTNQMNGPVFVCNDQQPSGYNFTDVSDPNQCGPLLGPLLDPALDLVIQQGLRLRLAADLCQGSGPSYDSTGCVSDCQNNHQYATGVCVNNASPTATFANENQPSFQCDCSY